MLCVSFSCATCVARPSAPRPAGALASCWRSQRIYPAPGRREIAGPGSEGRSRTILGGCQGACPLIGAGVGRGGSRDRRRLRSSGAQRISRSLALSPLSFFFVASLRDDLARLERTTIRLLSQRHLVFVVNSGWVCSARLFICSRKESGWIETVIRLLLSRRGYRFELRSFDPADWSGVYSPSIRRATSFAFRA